MKYETILRTDVWRSYRALPLMGRIFCSLARHNPDYSMFIAGIIAGIPATLLMNLVTLSAAEWAHPVLYGTLYAVSFIASAVFCCTFFRISVLHEGLHKEAEKMAAHGHGTEEEKINDLVILFEERYRAYFRRSVYWFTGSMILTVSGIAATFLVQFL